QHGTDRERDRTVNDQERYLARACQPLRRSAETLRRRRRPAMTPDHNEVRKDLVRTVEDLEVWTATLLPHARRARTCRQRGIQLLAQSDVRDLHAREIRLQESVRLDHVRNVQLRFRKLRECGSAAQHMRRARGEVARYQNARDPKWHVVSPGRGMAARRRS